MRRRQGILSKDLRWPEFNLVTARRAPPGDAMARFIAESGGLPRAINSKDVKDEVIKLLRVAAEIEHALMVQYLFAAYSLKPDADPQYRLGLVTIAKQEMGHFVTAQNLLRLLGANPHLDRDDLLPRSGKEPGPFLLESVSADSLAKYAVIESPLDEHITGPARLAYDRARARINPKSMTQLNRVGALYVVLYWMFMRQDDPEPDEVWRLNPDDILRHNPDLKGVHLRCEDFSNSQYVSEFMTVPDDWRVNVGTIYVDETIDRKTAKTALFKISSQGEGISGDVGQKSHFERFLDLFLAAEQNEPPTFSIAAGKAKSAPGEAAQTVMELFNIRYQILLLLIDATLRIPRSDPSRPVFSNLAVDEMHLSIGGIANAMFGLVGGPTHGPIPPSFELPEGQWPEDSLPNLGKGLERLSRLLNKSRKHSDRIRILLPGLIDGELDLIEGQNVSVEDAISMIPTS